MATTKSSTKSSPGKRSVPATVVVPAKAKPVTKPKPVVKPAPVVKPKPAPKTLPKAAAAKPARARAGKPTGVPLEQRRHYVEMAAYYIAERRGFAPGDPLEDWVQAEAEIDRLLAEGRLGG